jgi:hypothetical protein
MNFVQSRSVVNKLLGIIGETGRRSGDQRFQDCHSGKAGAFRGSVTASKYHDAARWGEKGHLLQWAADGYPCRVGNT